MTIIQIMTVQGTTRNRHQYRIVHTRITVHKTRCIITIIVVEITATIITVVIIMAFIMTAVIIAAIIIAMVIIIIITSIAMAVTSSRIRKAWVLERKCL